MPTARLSASILAAAALLAGCAHDPIQGAWHSRVEFTKGDASAMKGLEFMYAFNAGGTLLESSNYDAAPPVPPAYGAWRRTGPGHYEARYLFFTTRPPESSAQLAQGWLPAGTGELVEHITLSEDGGAFASTITLRLLDAAGKPLEGTSEGVGHARRVGF
jgi:hypothetical protein